MTYQVYHARASPSQWASLRSTIKNMVRIQIRLPDQLYARVKELCGQREWTIAEAMRRAAEQLVETHPLSPPETSKWRLPAPKQLGPFLARPEVWRELANK